jgi:hypothetical protein
MISLREIIVSLYGAYRLAWMDSKAAAYFDNTPDACWRSFFAAVLVLPFYGVILIAKYSGDADLSHPFRFITVEICAYIIAWVAFPLMMVSVARLLSREDKYFGFICAYNWASILQNAVYLPVAYMMLMGVQTAAPLGLLILIGLMIYTWFIAKTLLDIDGIAAAGIVFMDLLISILVTTYADVLILRS